jgi:hypothetical protein
MMYVEHWRTFCQQGQSVMSNLRTYLPQDRLRALARGETLPDRTSGAAIFADISVST